MFAREAAACATTSSIEIPSTQTTDRTLTSAATDPSDRTMSTGALEPSVLMSPDRKRTFEIDNEPPSLVGFSDTELDDAAIQIHNPTHSNPIQSLSNKKAKCEDYNQPAATIPELPRINDELVSNFYYYLNFPTFIYLLLN